MVTVKDRLKVKGHRVADDGDIFDQTKLPDLAKWSTSGFAALTAVLTFLGVRDALLTRILSVDTTAALWSMLMIAAGLVISTFGLAVKGDAIAPAWLLVAAVTAASAMTAWLLDDLEEKSTQTTALLVGSLAGLVALAIVFLVMGQWLPLSVALVVLATACTGLGLYTAAKISVTAQAGPEDLRVTADLTGTTGAQTLEITLAGSKQPAQGTVAVLGTRTPAAAAAPSAVELDAPGTVWLWQASFSADGNKTVAESYSVPVDLGQWSRVSVLTCPDPGCVLVPKQTLAGGRAVTPPTLGGTVTRTPGASVLTAKVTAGGLLNSEYVRVWVRPAGSTAVLRSTSALTQTLIPDENGAVTWSGKVATTTGVRSWDLRAAVCSPGSPCRLASAGFLARYKRP